MFTYYKKDKNKLYIIKIASYLQVHKQKKFKICDYLKNTNVTIAEESQGKKAVQNVKEARSKFLKANII